MIINVIRNVNVDCLIVVEIYLELHVVFVEIWYIVVVVDDLVNWHEVVCDHCVINGVINIVVEGFIVEESVVHWDSVVDQVVDVVVDLIVNQVILVDGNFVIVRNVIILEVWDGDIVISIDDVLSWHVNSDIIGLIIVDWLSHIYTCVGDHWYIFIIQFLLIDCLWTLF